MHTRTSSSLSFLDDLPLQTIDRGGMPFGAVGGLHSVIFGDLAGMIRSTALITRLSACMHVNTESPFCGR